MTSGGSASNSLMAERLIVSRKSPTQFAFSNQTLLNRVERFSRLLAALIGSQRVIKVFPQLAVLREVGLNREFVALVIGDESNAFHGLLDFLPFLLSCHRWR